MSAVQDLIKKYHLQPHPEGGWYKETYRSAGLIPAEALPEKFGGDRAFSTAIYFLLEQGNFSAFHRIKSDECWHFYAGDPLEVYVLLHDGTMEIIRLGNDSNNDEVFQYIVPANCWFASRPSVNSSYCFVGCTVAPGFDFADFEMARAGLLSNEFPAHTTIIQQLCR